MTRATVVLLLAWSVLPASGQGKPPDPFSGRCFDLEMGEWSPPLHPAAHRLHALPEIAYLLPVADTSFSVKRFHMLPAPPPTREPHRAYALWRRLSVDSARLFWTPNGFTGIEADVVIDGRRIEGIAEATGDAIPIDVDGTVIPWPRARLSGMERPCPRDLLGEGNAGVAD